MDIDSIFTIALGIALIYGAVQNYKHWRRANAGLPGNLYRTKIAVGVVLVGSVVLWFTCCGVLSYYDHTRLTVPDIGVGRTYSLTSHGHVVYVTLMEYAFVIFLGVVSFLLFFIGYVLEKRVSNAVARFIEDSQSTGSGAS